MVFKRNVTITVACLFNELLLSFIPSIFIVYIFFFLDKISEIYLALLVVPLMMVVFDVVLLIISFICQIFMKTKYYVGKDSLIVQEKEKTKEINYNEITDISYDFGRLGIPADTTSSQLVLFCKDSKEMLTINSPSIIMTHIIRKRCKNAKTCYYNNKRLLFFLALTNGIVLVVSILGKIFI